MREETNMDLNKVVLVTREMIDRVGKVIQHYKPGSDNHFYLKDFLDVVDGVSQQYLHIDHFRHIKWVFCIELSGRDECEVFGSGEVDCPFCQARTESMPTCPLWEEI